ncbi:MAG TPA: type II toxin-antitoxin system VapC family toxin [Solirubrobacteraceae bacterium]
MIGIVATADVLVDTDVLIGHLRGKHRLSGRGRSLGVSVISRYELFAGRDEHERLRAFLRPMTELPINPAIAELAGVTRRESGIQVPDALIAATALAHGIPVMTRNRRRFARVAGLRVIAPD